MTQINRRDLSMIGLPLTAAALLGLGGKQAWAQEPTKPELTNLLPNPTFPYLEQDRVRGIVGASHTNPTKVKLLLSESPALANAGWDWGLGDFETPLGAASHMGRRDIAEMLLNAGARPDIFSHAMLGNLKAVQGAIEAMPGVQKIDGPHGLTLLHHARAGGSEAKGVRQYLESLGDADLGGAKEPLLAPMKAYFGTYIYGSGETERFDIVEFLGKPAFHHPTGYPKALFHLGNHEFHPGAVRAVRFKFEMKDGQGDVVRVYDSGLQVTARRSGGK